MEYLNTMDIISFYETNLSVIDIDSICGLLEKSFSIVDEYAMQNYTEYEANNPRESIDFSFNAGSVIQLKQTFCIKCIKML